MTWHWSYKTLPELAGLPDDEKARVWEQAGKRGARRPAFWAGLVGGQGAMSLLSQTGPVIAWAGLPPGWAAAAAAAAGFAAMVTILVLTTFAATRAGLLRELPGRCRGCGYDLTGNASGACPECGRAA
ncbi:MAG: hypothetical protein JWO31_2489 [Phycisphaerales bacterium]|nr:hypothetical protein [Phycisphaerales bacterium]